MKYFHGMEEITIQKLNKSIKYDFLILFKFFIY